MGEKVQQAELRLWPSEGEKSGTMIRVDDCYKTLVFCLTVEPLGLRTMFTTWHCSE